ncbi:MAG: hypothetical protein AAFQ01_00750, partial [Bacteroidota bacterium]
FRMITALILFIFPESFWHSKTFLGIVTVFVLATQILPLFQSKRYGTTGKGYCETHHQHDCCKSH